MAKLTTSVRKKIPTGKFALPAERKYPVQDRAHAGNAKARAQQQYNKGNLSKAELDKIDAAANKVLNKGKKGETKMAKNETKKSVSKTAEKVKKGDGKMAMKQAKRVDIPKTSKVAPPKNLKALKAHKGK